MISNQQTRTALCKTVYLAESLQAHFKLRLEMHKQTEFATKALGDSRKLR